MTYQTSIPDDFIPPQYLDQRFRDIEELWRRERLSATGPHVIAIPRPDLNPESRIRFNFGDHVDYPINLKIDKVAVMQVVAVGKGRVRMGFREVIPVQAGDLVLVNLREAGHWLFIGGEKFYDFTADVAMARMYRTTKTVTPPPPGPERDIWNEELFWNIKDVLNDYVLCGYDAEAARKMRNGPETLVHLTDKSLRDGTRSDDARDSRFPIVYRRVLGAGPGRVMRRESDLGIVEREETISEAQPGDMIAFANTVRAASFTFQGMPLEAIHCASTIVIKHADETRIATGAPQTIVHESCQQPIPWDMPKDDEDEEPETRPDGAHAAI